MQKIVVELFDACTYFLLRNLNFKIKDVNKTGQECTKSTVSIKSRFMPTYFLGLFILISHKVKVS